MNWIRMRDFWTIKSKDFLDKNKRVLECLDSSIGHSLMIPVAATHSGTVNNNWRFYRPDKMQAAASQWIPVEGKTFAKPVLFEHNKKGEVLGRVHTARYIDETYKWIQDNPSLKDAIFYDKKMDLFKSVDWIVDNLISKPDYSGLGYLELGLNITNPDAVDKAMRDEYLTVSVGFQTNAAICSICHQDWAADDKCDHHPGMKDEESGRKAFLICGDFKYEEISFVNFPADPFAGKVTKDSLKDSLNRIFFMGLDHNRQQEFVNAAGMSMTDARMDFDIQIVEDTVAEPKVPVEEISTDEEIKVAISNDKNECNCDVDWTKEQLSAEETEFFTDEDGLYAELAIEIDAAVAAGELDVEQVKDAKLSTEQRSKLGTSTFCGPGRSFPVPDCAHVVAARRLIGRAKVSDATKSKILSCVSSKASSLGCGGKKDSVNTPQVAEKSHTIQIQDSELKQFVDEAKVGSSSADVLNHYDGLHKLYKASDDDLKSRMRHLHYRVGEHWDSASSLQWAREHVKTHAKDEVLVTSKDWQDNQDKITKLTEDVKTVNDSVIAAKNTSVEMLKAVKKALATQIVMYKSLTGSTEYKDLDQTGRDAKVEELSKRHMTSLKDAVADLMSELKWVAPTEAKPVVKVEEPGKPVADSAKVQEPLVDSVSTETEEETTKRRLAESSALQDRLSLMTHKERVVYLANLAFDDAKAKK